METLHGAERGEEDGTEPVHVGGGAMSMFAFYSHLDRNLKIFCLFFSVLALERHCC